MRQGVVGVIVLQILRALKRALLVTHRWFMKYSGMTMIIDNIEERRRGRQNEDQLQGDSGHSEEDSASRR